MDALGAGPIHALRPHRALFIPEILRNILEYTHPHDDPNFALVCRQWLEPALNAIWNKLGDIDTLAMFTLLEKLARKKIKEHLIGDNQPSEQEVFVSDILNIHSPPTESSSSSTYLLESEQTDGHGSSTTRQEFEKCSSLWTVRMEHTSTIPFS